MSDLAGLWQSKSDEVILHASNNAKGLSDQEFVILQNELRRRGLSTISTAIKAISSDNPSLVKIVDIDIPFRSIFILMLKSLAAAIPVAIIWGVFIAILRSWASR
jgi:hypothetical protein